MLTQDRLVTSTLSWILASALVAASNVAVAQEEFDFGESGTGNDELAGSPDSDPMAALDREERESQAYAFAVAASEALEPIAREVNSAIRDVVAADPHYSIAEADARLNGLDPNAVEALEQAHELFDNGRRAYENLELEEAYELFDQALQTYEDQVAHAADLNFFTSCLLYLGASETLRSRRRQANDLFGRMLIIDPERRPDENIFPPPVIEAFEAAQRQVSRLQTGTIEVTSVPEGAHLYLDGVLMGPTPQTLEDVRIGRHYVRARMQGHVEAGQVVELASRRRDATASVELTLDPTPIGPEVEDLVLQLPEQVFNDREQATASVQQIGEHLGIEVLLTAIVYEEAGGVRIRFNVWDVLQGASMARVEAGPYDADAFVVAGEATGEGENALAAAWSAMNVPQVVDVPQTPEPPPPPPPPRPFWQRWWFWTAIGVAVVGAGVGIGFGVASASGEDGPTNGEVIIDL